MNTAVKTIKKWFFVWDFEKEETWLNEMAQSGWALARVGFATFHFIRCDPGEYTIRLEMHQPDDSYLELMRETGAEYIGRVTQWIYFRKKTSLGEFDIFSDLDSRISHLDKIGLMLTLIGFGNILMGVSQSITRNGLGWINLLIGSLLMYGLGRIHGMKTSLEKERLLRE